VMQHRPAGAGPLPNAPDGPKGLPANRSGARAADEMSHWRADFVALLAGG